jgi:hypothetical protein
MRCSAGYPEKVSWGPAGAVDALGQELRPEGGRCLMVRSSAFNGVILDIGNYGNGPHALTAHA